MKKHRKVKTFFFASLRSIFRKEFIHIARNPSILVLAFALPIFELTLVGFAAELTVKQIRTVVYDLANTQESRALIDRFVNTYDFNIVHMVNSDTEMDTALVSGEARVGIKIPVDYSRRLLSNQTAVVKVLIDGSDSIITTEAVNVSNLVGLQESIKQSQAQSLSQDSNAAKPFSQSVEIRPSVLFNPKILSKNFLIPGFIGFLLTGITIMLSATAMVAEYEKGTMDQLYMTPINHMGLILGKVLPYGILAFVELGVLLIVLRTIFDIPINGNPLLIMLLAIPFIASGLGFGLLIAAAANTQTEVSQMSIAARVLSGIWFSGFFFPVHNMPEFFQWVTRLVPDRYFMEIVRGVILRGAGIEHLWRNEIALIVISLIVITIGGKRFQRKLG